MKTTFQEQGQTKATNRPEIKDFLGWRQPSHSRNDGEQIVAAIVLVEDVTFMKQVLSQENEVEFTKKDLEVIDRTGQLHGRALSEKERGHIWGALKTYNQSLRINNMKNLGRYKVPESTPALV